MSKSPHESRADSRMEIRLSQSLKSEIEEAAAIQGVSVSAFAVASVLEAARKVRRDLATTRMCDQERDAFVELLTQPPAPTPELIDLMGTKVNL